MSKFLYPIRKLKIETWIKYWLLKKSKGEQGTLSEIIEGTSPLTLENSIRKKFHIFKVKGNTVQNGEPTPEAPIPVENVSGEVEVKVENKNLFDENKADWKLFNPNYPATYDNENKGWYNHDYMQLILTPQKTQTISFKIKKRTLKTGEYNYSSTWELRKDGSVVIYDTGSSSSTYVSIKYTMEEGHKYLLTVYNHVFIADIQIEEGSTATSYEPHEEQTATFPLAEGQVLHETDTIEDKIVQRRKTVILDGSQPENKFSAISALNTADYNCFLYNDSTIAKATNDSDINVISNKLIGTGSNKRTTNMANCWINHFAAGQLGMHIPNTVTNTTELLEYLTNNPITFEYKLVEPLEIPFTEAQKTAKAQIDNLYSYKGTTHISSTNVPSPVFEVQYYMEGE